ncbi:SDR family NAD(P)-dependent oxidoreductase [Propylenella binzhouense]|uniref:SDR family oxidoreductase n=1 Tax=Propylenella binzhouense TaxID=2555902 RepID=A0A964T5Y6_9HYPH|nr:SDR family oxidoreductase [Propylenella binzhouense]MYZ49133.1 SDR family oxidoreductase [Propylenella binzhouense]
MSSRQGSQTVLVTGAASGIGRACVRHLLATGERVLAMDLRLADLEAAFPERPEMLALREGDVRSAEDCAAAVDAAVAAFGRLDALMHWAGRHSIKPWEDLTAADLNAILEVNVTGSFLIAQAAARHMRRNRSGAIVLTGSTAVIHAPIGGAAGNGGPAYVASKAAITGLVRSLARALGPDNIRVNAVAPGVTETPMIGNYSAETREAQTRQSPMGRIGTAEEVAEAGCMLISQAARYVSGEVLIVNGATSFG